MCSVAQSWLTLCSFVDCSPARLLCPWDFLGKNTGVGCHFLLQGIFSIHGWNPCLLHWQADSLPLSHQGSPDGQSVTATSCLLLLSLQSITYWNLYLAETSVSSNGACQTSLHGFAEESEVLDSDLTQCHLQPHAWQSKSHGWTQNQ